MDVCLLLLGVLQLDTSNYLVKEEMVSSSGRAGSFFALRPDVWTREYAVCRKWFTSSPKIRLPETMTPVLKRGLSFSLEW